MNFNTSGIKYLGSKKSLLENIYNITKDLSINTVFDGFAGSTRVGQLFKNYGKTVISNDINIWSKVFGECYLVNNKPRGYFVPLIAELNLLNPKSGWFSKNYGGIDNDGSSVQLDGCKRIWQMHVTNKLDAIRDTIDEWVELKKIDEIDKSVLLTSLIMALDKVDSTLGHQVSYLREWSPRSYKQLELIVPDFNLDNLPHQCICGNTLELNGNIEVDLAYFDPPYGSSNDIMPSSRVRYGQYYHLWKTVILNDRPELIGKIKKRIDANVENTFSTFEDYRKDENDKFLAQTAIESLFLNSKSKFVLFSYNTNSRVPVPNIIDFLTVNNFHFTLYSFEYRKNIMASMVSSEDWMSLKDKTNQEIMILVDNANIRL